MLEKTAYTGLGNFFEATPFVILGTGISCAVDTDFGMKRLQEYLETELEDIAGTQKREWDKVRKTLSNGKDLECALDHAQDEDLIKKIVEHTAALMLKLDLKYREKIFNGSVIWPMESLIKKMFGSIKVDNHVLHIATTNYDMLPEYSFEKNGLPYSTGFYGVIERKLNWSLAERPFHKCKKIRVGSRLYCDNVKEPHIKLHKVHGSINTFEHNGNIMENNLFIHDKPHDIERLMITPGVKKHEKLHHVRDELLGEYDKALSNQYSLLFAGFGFNDTQLINATMKRKIQEDKCSTLIVTRDSNQRIESLIGGLDNVWLVCSEQGNENNTLIRKGADEIIIHGEQFWKIDAFTKKILGGN